MDAGNCTHRRLGTQSRERSRSRQSSRVSDVVRQVSRICSRNHSRSHSRSRSRGHNGSKGQHLLDRELALKREQERIRRMEEDLQRERDHGLRRRSENRSSTEARPVREQRSCSRQSRGHGRMRRDTTSPDHHTNRSCTPTFSSKDLIQIIKSMKDVLPSQSTTYSTVLNKDHKNIIPEFNPSEKNQRIDVWLRKVNECAKVYGWDEKTVIHFAMQKLSGLAKTWYESLNTIMYSWTEWQTKLIDAFPAEQNYGQLLEDMLKRRSRTNEPIEIYFYEKLALLNQCEITDRHAVDCIIHGIGDRTIRSSALALRCERPDQLLKFLLSNDKEFSPQVIPFSDRNMGTTDDGHNNSSNAKTNPNLYCYNCKEKGHPYSTCSKPLIKCSHCNKVGHEVEVCRNKNDTGFTKTDSVAKMMHISSNSCQND